jgi:hypothetical protein
MRTGEERKRERMERKGIDAVREQGRQMTKTQTNNRERELCDDDDERERAPVTNK